MEWGTTDAEKKKHLLRKSTSPLGIVNEYTYDSHGNQLTSKTSNGSLFMKTTSGYDEDGNHVLTQTDARGKTVTHVMNPSNWIYIDTVQSITDLCGQTVEYEYDQNRKVTKTSATVNGKEYANSYAYTKDKLTQVKHNTSASSADDVTYNFAYDAVGRPTTVKVGTQALSTTAYNADGTVANVTYGNGGKMVNAYDGFKRVTGVRYDNETTDRFSYTYGANGEVAQVKDNVRGTTVTSEYDVANRPQRKTTMEGSTHAYTGEVTYDQYNNLATFKEQVGSGRTAYTTTFTHDNENRPTLLNFGGTRQVGYAYDGIGRISQRTVNAGGTAVATAYGYLAGGHGTGSTTPLVQTITQSGATLTYAYDDCGNITSVSDGVKTISYAYDLLGQLIRANDPYDTTAGSNGTTWVYAYDLGGNILSKTAYAYTTGTVGAALKTDSFTYGDANWKDKLTAYNGAAISYDAIGNPLSDSTWTYTWAKGRQLQRMSKSGETVSFVYNEDGLRVQKAATSTGTTKYTLHGKNIVHMTNGSNTLHFFYDVQNKPAVVLFNGTAYAYLYNLQGDVIALVDANGSKVVEYKYDAWGKPISKTGTLASTLGTVQPFRYRGYAYDEETELYYLKRRYYHASLARFISADANLNSGYVLFPNNQFCYCLNNPVMGIDCDGLAPSFGYFHALVQKDFAATHPGVVKELGFYKYGDGSKKGRADFVNVSTGEVWEIKPHMAGYNRNPVRYLNRALDQLDSYIEGEITNGEIRKQLKNKNLHPGGIVPARTIYDAMTDMDITYWSAGDGIIWYEISSRQYLKSAPVVVPEPERSKSRSYSAQPSASDILGSVFMLLLYGAAYLMRLPALSYAY